MKIYFSPYRIINNNNNNRSNLPKLNPLSFDTVSFKGKRNLEEEMKNLPKEDFPSPELREYMLSRIDEENVTIADIHKCYYSRLNSCKTLEEAREIYPEFRQIIDIKEMKEQDPRNTYGRVIQGKVKGANVENFSIGLLREYFGNLTSIADKEAYFNLSKSCILRCTEGLNIQAFSKYLSLVRLQVKYTNEINSKQTPEFSKKCSDAITRDWNTPERREIRIEALKGAHRNAESKEKQSEAMKKLWQRHEYREKISEAMKRVWAEPKYSARKAQLKKEHWKNPEFRKLMEIVAAANRIAWQVHPNAKKVYKEIALEFPALGVALHKRDNKEELTPYEISCLSGFYKACAERYPNLHKEIGRLQKDILKEWGFYEDDRNIDELISFVNEYCEE